MCCTCPLVSSGAGYVLLVLDRCMGLARGGIYAVDWCRISKMVLASRCSSWRNASFGFSKSHIWGNDGFADKRRVFHQDWLFIQ